MRRWDITAYRTMKKIYQSAILAFIILCGMHFAGCNPSEGNTPSTSTTELWPAQGNNGKWGYINKKGAFVIQPAYEKAENFSCGYAAVKLNSTYMFIDAEGKLQNSPSITGVSYLGFVNNYVVVESGDHHWGVLDKSFSYVIQPIYYELGSSAAVAANGLVSFRYTKDEKVGFLDVKTGKVAIQPQYDYFYYPFLDGYASVGIADGKYGKWGVINASGEYVTQPIYDMILNFGNKRFAYSLDGENWGIMNEKWEIIANPIFDNPVYGLQGFDFPVSDLIPIQNKSTKKYGYLDMNGNEKIPFQYEFVYPFAEGYATVGLNDREAVINKNGEIVFMLNEREQALHCFKNGLLLTEERNSNNKTTYRYRDTEGNIIYLWNN